MKKKRTAESAFLKLWILLGLLAFFSGIVLSLGQRATTRRSTSENTTQLTATSSDSRRAAAALLMPEFPTAARPLTRAIRISSARLTTISVAQITFG
jgi:hypothetical protein